MQIVKYIQKMERSKAQEAVGTAAIKPVSVRLLLPLPGNMLRQKRRAISS